jgi:hypothetical protein
MNNFQSDLNKLYQNIATIKSTNKNLLTDKHLEQLNNLLDGTDLASKQDPNFFYNLLQDYKAQSETLLRGFYEELENDKKFQYGTTILVPDIDYLEIINMDTSINYSCSDTSDTCNITEMLKDIPYNDENKRYILKLKYEILQNNIEILRTYIRAQREVLGDTINDMRNNEHFATTLNSDYSEIYKYKYLRNWGIFLSILGGAYFFKKMK